MDSIKTLIIDDELACVESLAIELEEYCPEIELVGKCNDPKESIRMISELKPDLIFLDIEMPWMNGFEILEQFDPIPFEVIFVTAYDQFALKAFQFSAVDYLLKPNNKAQLISAVDKVKKRIEKSITKDHLKALLDNIKKDKPLKNIAIPNINGVDFIAIDDIMYCEADNNYSTIHLKDKQKTIVSKSLKTIEQMFSDHSFVRIHHSYIVNMDHVKKYIKTDGGYVVMSDGKQLSVSRSRKEDLVGFIKSV
jgi:two-component system LytT family response regulator